VDGHFGLRIAVLDLGIWVRIQVYVALDGIALFALYSWIQTQFAILLSICSLYYPTSLVTIFTCI
jgi:hypothetical protein